MVVDSREKNGPRTRGTKGAGGDSLKRAWGRLGRAERAGLICAAAYLAVGVASSVIAFPSLESVYYGLVGNLTGAVLIAALGLIVATYLKVRDLGSGDGRDR